MSSRGAKNIPGLTFFAETHLLGATLCNSNTAVSLPDIVLSHDHNLARGLGGFPMGQHV